jgi:hypothetical protein
MEDRSLVGRFMTAFPWYAPHVDALLLARGIVAQDTDLSTDLIDRGVTSTHRLDARRLMLIITDLFAREALIRTCTTIASNLVPRRPHRLVDSSPSHNAVTDLRGSLG